MLRDRASDASVIRIAEASRVVNDSCAMEFHGTKGFFPNLA